MSLFSRKNSDYTKGERIFTAIVSFNIFAIIGGIVRLFNGPITLSPTSELAAQFLPVMLGFGFIAAVLAYFFPKVFQIILIFLPVPGGSN